VPSTLDVIAEDYKLNPLQQGVLGSVSYLGLTVMSPVSGTLLQRYNPKHIVLYSLAAKILFTVAFILSVNSTMLLLTRCLVGFSQSKSARVV
jgi:MFS family permease